MGVVVCKADWTWSLTHGAPSRCPLPTCKSLKPRLHRQMEHGIKSRSSDQDLGTQPRTLGPPPAPLPLAAHLPAAKQIWCLCVHAKGDLADPQGSSRLLPALGICLLPPPWIVLVAQPGSPHLLGLRRHRYSLLLLAWEDVQALFPSEEHSVTLTWDPGTKSKRALMYGAKHGAGIFSHSLLFSSFLASLEGRSQRTFIWQLRQRLRPVKPLPEVMGPGRGRGGI